jgi:coenzyme F420-dependent glucose-6-phosphate dehydrogenase
MTTASIRFGYTLSSEEHGPTDLVANAVAAEAAGFDFVSMSDHFHPWIGEQGHSPFVWAVLGAVASRTEQLDLAVGVTCPIIRIHPAIVAHAAATTSVLADGRFSLGVGSGEALNEHVLGHRWPPAEVRLARLEEAIAILRALWTGETVDHRGDFYEVENAKLFDPPEQPIPIIVSGFGPKSVELAARLGDGYWGHSPEREVIDQYRASGGQGPRYAQVNLCWAPDAAAARKTVHQIWPTAGIPGQLSQDLPTWKHFEQAAELVTEEAATKTVPCGPDVRPVVDAVQAYVDAGYDHVYLHQIGPDQDGFLRFWTDELRSAVSDLAPSA